MAGLGNLSNVAAWGLAVLIAYLERRDAAQSAAAAASDEGAPDASAPAQDEGAPTETESAQPAAAPADPPIAPSREPDLAARLLEADEVPPSPAPNNPPAPGSPSAAASPADAATAPDDRAAVPTAAAPDPLIETHPGQTIVGPDAPIHVPAPHVPAGAVPGDGTPVCPDDHPFKGNASSMIYHSPGQPNYDRTVAEFCFESEETAEAAGYRPPKR